MRNPVIARSHLRRSDDIFEHRVVLHLRYADHDRIILIDTGNVEKHLFGITQLLRILDRIPFFRSFRREFVVIDLGIVDRIEKVLQVVKDHLVRFLRETAGCEQ